MLNVGILCSKRAPALDELLRSPSRGSLFDISCVITSQRIIDSNAPLTFGLLTAACGRGVPLITNPVRGRAREERDAETAAILNRYNVDVVVFLGYLWIVSAPLLGAFRHRIFNVHDADLTLRNPEGGPRYPGLHATRDAIRAGEPETRSSAHLVTEAVDAGPVVALSEPFPVAPFVAEAVRAGAADVVSAYAYAQREWMMRSCWSGLVIDALRAFAMEAVA